MEFTDLSINRQWHKGTDRFDAINPATEEVLASADIADADTALDAAKAARAARTSRARTEVLRRARELMTARLDQFAHLITPENGKARADAMGEAANATEDGLVAHLLSGDFKRVLQVRERLIYGMAGLYRSLVSDPAAPFGCTMQSGPGREGGHEGMPEFMETRYIPANR